MIKKFNQDSFLKFYERGFAEEKFINRTLSAEEEANKKLLETKIDKYVKKVYGDKLTTKDFEKSLCDGYSYLSGYGYYYYINSNRCAIDVYSLGDDLEDAFKTFIVDNECYRAIEEEHRGRRDVYEDDYTRRFHGLRYLSCVYFAELPLQKWEEFYEGNVPTDIISHYENYLNGLPLSEEENVEWSYSNETPGFTYHKKENSKKLIKK